MARTPIRTIRVGHRTWRMWRMAAALHDLPLTTWLHRVADAAAERTLQEAPAPTAAIIAEGSEPWRDT